MLDIGGWEFLLIVVLGIMIIGPKELPGAIRTVSAFVRRARELARDFQSGLEEVAREAEFDKVKDELTGAVDPDGTIGSIRDDLERTIDPDDELRHAMDYSREWSDDDLLDIPGDSPDVAGPEGSGSGKPDSASRGRAGGDDPPHDGAPDGDEAPADAADPQTLPPDDDRGGRT